jgi:post-segregation antitoxin (ccd killing protein)
MSEVVTIRVEKSLKQKIRKYKINVSKTVRTALEEEVKKNEDAEFLRALDDMKTLLQKVPEEEIVRAIRESRDQR